MSRSILFLEVETTDAAEVRDIGFAYNTLVFEVITEGIRAGFLPSQKYYESVCFTSLDDAGLDYLSLWDIDSEAFTVFVHASERGLETLHHTRDVAIDYDARAAEIDVYIAVQGELCQALRKDPCFKD